MARRMIFVSLAVYFTDSDSVDALITAVFFMETQLIINAYLLHKMPLDSYKNNCVEVVNEFLLLVQTYFVVAYSGVVTQIETL